MTMAWSSGNQANSRKRAGASRQPTPMPRNDASRMKFEKYDSSRTCAGIQRMSATSRNRTRNDARKTRNGLPAEAWAKVGRGSADINSWRAG